MHQVESWNRIVIEAHRWLSLNLCFLWSPCHLSLTCFISRCADRSLHFIKKRQTLSVNDSLTKGCNYLLCGFNWATQFNLKHSDAVVIEGIQWENNNLWLWWLEANFTWWQRRLLLIAFLFMSVNESHAGTIAMINEAIKMTTLFFRCLLPPFIIHQWPAKK